MSDALRIKNSYQTIIIQFNRPEIRSPLSIFVIEEIRAILNKTSNDAAVKKVIFTGREDVFASGADLREIANITAETAKEFAIRGQSLMNKIEQMPQTTIAAVNGFCFGGALDLALACDKRIASPNAQFSHPGVNLGIVTGWGGTQRLPRLIGKAKALEVFLTAKRVFPEEALEIGLVDAIAAHPLEFALANYCLDSSSISL